MGKLGSLSSSISTGRSSRSSSGSGSMVGGKQAYPVIQMSDFRMGPDRDQQSMILLEMSTARTKLEEDNQRLRDELEDARMKIRFLQVKLEHQQKSTIKVKAVASGDSTVKGGLPGGYWKALDKAVDTEGGTRKGIFFNRKVRQPTKKEAFTNPAGPGRKTFLSKSTKPDAIANRSNTRSKKDAIKEDNTPYMIEFPTPQPEKPVRSRVSPPRSDRTRQKSQSLRVTPRITPSAPKQSDMVGSLQREIFLMASSSTADFPLEDQDESVYNRNQGQGDANKVAEQALQYSIMDQLEEADIPEEDEAEEEDEIKLSSSIMDQTANAVIVECASHSTTSSDLCVDKLYRSMDQTANAVIEECSHSTTSSDVYVD
jgi:hypothetical protein